MNNKDRAWYLISKKLANEASADELYELENLLRNDPEMHYALQHISDLWQLPVQSEPEAEAALDRHLARLQSMDADWQQPAEAEEEITCEPFPERPRRRRKYFITAGIITVVTVAALMLFMPRKEKPLVKNFAAAPKKNEVATGNGSRTKISLPDGSQVWLNSGSNIVYDEAYGNGLREVQLSGEAFFDVVKNAAAPFVIHTKQVDIKVLGTAFNVRSYPGEKHTETSLVRGVVEVTVLDRPKEKYTLKPNEKLVVAEEQEQKTAAGDDEKDNSASLVSLSKLTYTREDSTVVETAWVENKLVFDNEPFYKVAAKMERWYNVEFEFRDAVSKEFHFSGNFQNETLHQALEALRITAGDNFRYTIEANKVTIKRNN